MANVIRGRKIECKPNEEIYVLKPLGRRDETVKKGYYWNCAECGKEYLYRAEAEECALFHIAKREAATNPLAMGRQVEGLEYEWKYVKAQMDRLSLLPPEQRKTSMMWGGNGADALDIETRRFNLIVEKLNGFYAKFGLDAETQFKRLQAVLDKWKAEGKA